MPSEAANEKRRAWKIQREINAIEDEAERLERDAQPSDYQKVSLPEFFRTNTSATEKIALKRRDKQKAEGR